MHLLLVEDSAALADELMPRLKQAGYAVDWLADDRGASCIMKPGNALLRLQLETE